MRVYLCSGFSWKSRMIKFASELAELGIEVTSSWLSEDVEPDSTLDQFDDRYLQHAALTDIEDIRRSDVVVVFTIDPKQMLPRGGRHWETGFAYGIGKEIIIIGPRENLFHYLPSTAVFPTQERAKEYLRKRNMN